MSKDNTTNNSGDKSQEFNSAGKDQSASSSAQGQRDYENLINKSLEEQITDTAISRADITNPNLHYGIEEEVEKIGDVAHQTTKKEGKFLDQSEKSEIEQTPTRLVDEQNSQRIEELKSEELTGNDVPQSPGNLEKVESSDKTGPTDTLPEEETTPDGRTSGGDKTPETGTETNTGGSTTPQPEEESFNPDLVTTGNSVDENSAEGTVIATLNLEDAAGSVFVYYISDENGAPLSNTNFTIVGNELVVSGTADLDFESLQSHNIFITGIDGEGNSVTEPFAIEVNDVNEFDVSAITDADANTNAIDENAGVGTSVGITAFASDADGSNNGVTYSLSDDAGGLFTIDPNTGEVTVAGTIDFETATNHSIEVTATSEDGSTSTQTFAINVNDQDEFDVSAITDTDATTNAVDENASVGTSVGITAFASDADGSNNGVTYSLSDDAGGLFAIDPNTGEVTVAGAIDFETATNHSIEVTATSEDGSTSTQTFAINVNDQDEFDVSAITDTDGTTNAVDENVSVGTSVGITAFASDADGSNNGITYSLSDDAGGLFTIDPNTGEVTVAGSIDYETATNHSIEVTATSEDGSTSTQSYTINVNDQDEFDVSAITDTDTNVNTTSEWGTAGSTVGITASATDADGSLNDITYSIVDINGNPVINGPFNVHSSTGVVTVADNTQLDYEAATSQTIYIKALSEDGSESIESFVINITDNDEFDVSAITDTDGTTNAVDENSAVGTSVGITAFASDGDGSDDVTYSLSDDAGGLFAIDPNTGEVTVAGAIDFETATNHSIEVTATSDDGSTSTQTFTINVNDQDEFDVSAITDTDATTNAVDENASVGTSVGITAFASDADGTNNNVTYSLSDDAGGLFAIDPNTGEVTVAGTIDFETATNHSIEVTATSEDGSTSTQTFAINVNDQDEFDVSAITDTDASTNAVDENASVGTSVGITAFASDADGSNNGVTYSLSDDAGGLFAIDPNTGEVTVAGSIDFETATNHSIEVTATSDDGSTSTQTFAINVNDVNEGPTDITITGGTVNETVESGGTIGSAFDPSGSTVATLSTTDEDAGETFTYSITNDPSGHFEIVGNEVRVKSGQTIDYETATSHDLIIEVTDSNGATYSETITINVEDYEGSYTGASNADTHTGTSEEDTVSTGNGSDTIIGSDGADTIDGGTGNDTIDYSNSSEGVTVNLETGQGTGGQAEGDSYTSIENVIGSDNDDYVKGSYSEGTTANLGAGNDKFDNTQGYFNQHDTVYAEAGDDIVYTGDGNDTIDGGTGNDELYGEGGNDTILGGDGDDYIRGGMGDDTITGGAGDDTIIGDEYLGTDNDTVVYSGNWSDYTITQSGSYFTITDNRPGSPDGTDTVHTTIENFQFADATVPQADILNDAPTDITVTGGNIDEGSATSTVVATLGVTDADSFIPSETSTYSITNDPSGNFEIVGNEVRVKAGSTLDFESDTSHDITVQVTDVHGATYSETITINVNDVDEFDVSAITDTDGTANTVAENVSVGTSVGITAFASDADGSNNGVTYSLSDDAGGLFTIDANTGEVTVAGSIDYETATNHNIEVTATSDDGSTSTQTFAINVDNINESGVSAITDTDGTANAVDEDASVGAVVGITALATDADATDTVTYSLSDDAGGLFTIDVNTGVVTVASGLDAETATSHNIEVTATSTDGSTTTETFSIGVNDVNETSISAISDTDGSANSVSESATVGTAVGITALATDADVTDTVTYSLSSNPGSFFSIDANTGEVTVASGLDFETNEDHTIEVTATSTDGTTSTQSFTIDVTDDTSEATVSSITDTDGTTNAVDENSAVGTSVGITAFASDADSSDDVTYSLSDDAGGLFTIDPNTGEVTVAGNIDYETATSQTIEVTATSDDGSTSTQSYTINVNDVDEFDVSAITDTDNSANTVAENVSVGTSVGITAFASDADGSNNGVTYSLSDDAGGLFAIDPNTGEVTVAGSIDYETATNHNIEVTATSEDGSTSTQTFAINVNDQDEFDVSAITDTDGTANAVDEDASVGAVVGITALATDADATDTVTYSLSNDAGGLFTIDANTGVVTVASGLDAETATNHNIEVTATSTDGSTTTETFSIGVNDVNETSISAISDTDGSVNSVSESATVGTAVGITALATDADVTDTVTYSLSSNPGSFFSIDANTGEVTVANALDFETNEDHTIEVTATSTDGTTSTQSFTIDVTDDTSEASVSAITDTDGTTNAVDENSAVGTSVGITAFASDADSSDDVTYSLSDDAGGLFAIDPNTGEVTVAGNIDYETATSQTIEVTATSDDGSTSTQSYTINVNDVDEFDVSAITDTDGTANTVAENVSVGTSVGITAFASDADGSNNGVTYSLSDDAGGLFAIDPNTGEVTVAGSIDYETATNHNIEVTATSEDGSTSTQTFAINVNDQDEFDVSAITDTDGTANTVAENVSVGTSVGITAFASDADGSNNGVTYSLSDDAGGLFTIDANTGEVTVAGSIDYETATNHNIEVTATSEDGSTSTQTFAINVNDQDEFDVSAITDTDGTANAVDEDASVGAVVGITALATDADATDTVTYSLSNDAGGLFTIDANTGVVTVASGLDAETATNHNIEVTATSTDGSTTTETFSIGVNDVNETSISAISDTDGSANSVSESATVGTAVGITALATDADVTDTVTYSLSSNPGSFFSIDANTGEVTVANALDFETNEDHTIEVTATSTDGTTSTQSFTIDVTDDTSEASVSAITDTDGTTNAVDENSAVGTSVGITAFASDADSSDDVTYSLSDDAGGLFAIDPNTGEVTVAGNIDYETATSQTIEVTATSDDGSTSTQSYTINVNDVDEFDVSAITDTDNSANTVAENVSVGTSVGITAFASDADGSNNGVTYSLSDDAGGLFTIDPNTGEVTVAGSIDFETATNHNIEVTATSEDGSTSTQTFAINVNDQDEFDVSAITDTDGTANAVDEDASVGAVVGITALATDADGTDTVTYSLSNDAGGLFTIDANTGVVTVASGLDAETATNHNIEVTATSTDGSTTTETFSIGVNDVNETSISAISDTDGSANSVSESATVGTAVGITALATDADVTDTVTYSLSSNPGSFFSIDANTGEVTVANALDFETNEDHTIEVTATSTDGTTSTQSFTIDVTDENEAPTDIQFETTGIREDANRNDGIGEIELNVIDPDGDTNFTFTVSDGRFEVYEDGGSYFLQVKDGVSLDHETESSIDLTVTATDQGGLSYSEDVTLDVTDVNEAPIAQTVDLGTTNEDTGIVITEAQLLANSSDVDAGATLSVTDLTIQDNAHGSLTDNGNGTWTFNPTGDLSVDDVTFNFTVSDGTLTDSSTATIDVTAVADAPTLDLSTTSQDIITGSTTISSGFEGDVASIGATGNDGFVGSIGGWQTDSDAIEVKSETLGDGSTNQFIELNNDAIDFFEDASNIYQEIDTTDGGTYTVDFNFAPRPGFDGTINSIEVLVDGVVVKTISADGTADTAINWQSDTITFTGDGTPAKIEFRESGVDQDYGRGMYMDNIEITEDLPEGHANGMENTAIALPDITAATTDSDGSETLALTITSIPEGAVLTDGTNSFTATSGDTDIDVTSWQLDSITMTPPEEFSGDITLTVNATATDGSSQNTTSSDISITVHDDDDTFTGTATEDLYNGGAGDDTINGNDGNDWLLGGEGDDTINGGTGTDTLSGGDGSDLFIFQEGDGADTISGGAGASWTDTIELQDAMGGSDLGTYGTDWTVTLTEGSIEETNSDNILFSDDADGTINLQDGSSIDFTDIERIDW